MVGVCGQLMASGIPKICKPTIELTWGKGGSTRLVQNPPFSGQHFDGDQAAEFWNKKAQRQTGSSGFPLGFILKMGEAWPMAIHGPWPILFILCQMMVKQGPLKNYEQFIQIHWGLLKPWFTVGKSSVCFEWTEPTFLNFTISTVNQCLGKAQEIHNLTNSKISKKHLEPQWPLFLKVNPPQKTRTFSNQKQGGPLHLGLQGSNSGLGTALCGLSIFGIG